MRRILIDECINPRLALRLRSCLPQSPIDTVRDLEWAGNRDHLLIRKMDGCYDVFVTIDKGFEFEHDLKRLSFGIIVLSTTNNQMPSYERLLEDLISHVQSVMPGQLVHVRDPEF